MITNSNQSNNICYQSIPIRERILYLLYIHKSMTINELLSYFSPNSTDVNTFLTQLELEHIIQHTPTYTYSLIQTKTDSLLRILDLLYTNNTPLTKTEIRTIIKHKQLNIIIDILLRSRILYEYRAKLSKKIYLLLSDRINTMINQIDRQLITTLTESTDIADQSHLIMLQNQQDILQHQSEDICLAKITPSERKLVLGLYQTNIDNIQHMTRSVGKSELEICTSIFDGNSKLTKKAILSLIKKQYLRCSYRHKYYLNDHPEILAKIKYLFNQSTKKKKEL